MIEAEFIVDREDIELFDTLKKSMTESIEKGHSKAERNEFKVLVRENGEPVGIGLISVDKYFRIDSICVKKDKRNCGYGDLIVKMLIDKAFQLGAKIVYVDCPKEAVDFLKKIGFKLVEAVDKSDKNIPMSIIERDIKKCSH